MPGSSGDSASLVEPMRDKFFGQWSSSSVTNHFPVWGGGARKSPEYNMKKKKKKKKFKSCIRTEYFAQKRK
jgi:hypothetical protein